jgi:hypothetical protein
MRSHSVKFGLSIPLNFGKQKAPELSRAVSHKLNPGAIFMYE